MKIGLVQNNKCNLSVRYIIRIKKIKVQRYLLLELYLIIDTFFIVKIIYIIANIRLKILRIFVILMIEIMEILIFVKVNPLAF